MNFITEVSFLISLCIILNVIHIHHIVGKKEIVQTGPCSEYFERSIEDPNKRTTSWIPNKESRRLDCSICNIQDTAQSWLVIRSTILADDYMSVHVNVQMYRTKCDHCRNQDIEVYILYKVLPIGPIKTQEAIRILKNLKLVANLKNEKDQTMKTHNFHFEPKASALSIVFLSQGSCTLIKDITIFCFVCDKNNTSGVNMPRTLAPANGLERVNVSCGENTRNQGNAEAFGVCSSKGIWEIISPCMCKKGYTLNIENECTECQEQTYKDTPGNGECTSCPKNSQSSRGQIMCRCKSSFYRFQGKNYAHPCYGVPSSVEEINFIDVTESSVTLVWKPANAIPPEKDVLYDITCKKCPSGSESQRCKESCGSFLTFNPSQNNLTYASVIIQGLDENTKYQFVVYSKNSNSLRRKGIIIKTYKGSTDQSISVVTGILVALVVVMAIVISVLVFLLCRRKRGDASHTQPNTELPQIPDSGGGYEEPAQYAQLDSSKRVPIDANNYQSLNADNYTQLDRGLNEDVHQYASLNIG